jgi:hypothetical protein
VVVPEAVIPEAAAMKLAAVPCLAVQVVDQHIHIRDILVEEYQGKDSPAAIVRVLLHMQWAVAAVLVVPVVAAVVLMQVPAALE